MGIAHLYAHRERGEVVRDAVLFTVPEVDDLTALGTRRGATLLPQLRSAWPARDARVLLRRPRQDPAHRAAHLPHGPGPRRPDRTSRTAARRQQAVDVEDWALARTVMRVSDATRAAVVRHLKAHAEGVNRARGQAEAARAVVVSETVHTEQVKRVAGVVLRALRRRPGEGWATRRDLAASVAGRDQSVLDEAIGVQLDAGQIETDTTTNKVLFQAAPGRLGGVAAADAARQAAAEAGRRFEETYPPPLWEGVEDGNACRRFSCGRATRRLRAVSNAWARVSSLLLNGHLHVCFLG